MPVSRLQTVFAITHFDLSFPHFESCAIPVLEKFHFFQEKREMAAVL